MINVIKKDQIIAEVNKAREERKTQVESKVQVLFEGESGFENLYLREYFESLGFQVYVCIDDTSSGHYILDWSLTDLSWLEM